MSLLFYCFNVFISLDTFATIVLMLFSSFPLGTASVVCRNVLNKNCQSYTACQSNPPGIVFCLHCVPPPPLPPRNHPAVLPARQLFVVPHKFAFMTVQHTAQLHQQQSL